MGETDMGNFLRFTVSRFSVPIMNGINLQFCNKMLESFIFKEPVTILVIKFTPFVTVRVSIFYLKVLL